MCCPHHQHHHHHLGGISDGGEGDDARISLSRRWDRATRSKASRLDSGGLCAGQGPEKQWAECVEYGRSIISFFPDDPAVSMAWASRARDKVYQNACFLMRGQREGRYGGREGGGRALIGYSRKDSPCRSEYASDCVCTPLIYEQR